MEIYVLYVYMYTCRHSGLCNPGMADFDRLGELCNFWYRGAVFRMGIEFFLLYGCYSILLLKVTKASIEDRCLLGVLEIFLRFALLQRGVGDLRSETLAYRTWRQAQSGLVSDGAAG